MTNKEVKKETQFRTVRVKGKSLCIFALFYLRKNKEEDLVKLLLHRSLPGAAESKSFLTFQQLHINRSLQRAITHR